MCWARKKYPPGCLGDHVHSCPLGRAIGRSRPLMSTRSGNRAFTSTHVHSVGQSGAHVHSCPLGRAISSTRAPSAPRPPSSQAAVGDGGRSGADPRAITSTRSGNRALTSTHVHSVGQSGAHVHSCPLGRAIGRSRPLMSTRSGNRAFSPQTPGRVFFAGWSFGAV